MRTLEEALNYFAWHPSTPATAPRHAALRDLFAEFVQDIWDIVPDGPDKTTMLRDLWRAQTVGNLAIALTAPADAGETSGTVWVLPPPE